jgi:hypothetical protein
VAATEVPVRRHVGFPVVAISGVGRLCEDQVALGEIAQELLDLVLESGRDVLELFSQFLKEHIDRFLLLQQAPDQDADFVQTMVGGCVEMKKDTSLTFPHAPGLDARVPL